MSRLRTALLVGFIASSAWMFCALLFNLFVDDNRMLDEGGRSSVAWIGVGVLCVVFLITLLIANSMHHSSSRRRDRKQMKSMEKQHVRDQEEIDRANADRAEWDRRERERVESEQLTREQGRRGPQPSGDERR